MRVREVFETLLAYNQRPLEFLRGELTIDNGCVQGYLQGIPEILAECEELGSGNFSSVFAINDRLVVKVACNNVDHAYHSYAEWASRNQSNPYVPRIYYIHREGSCRFYIMERLERYPSHYAFDENHAWVEGMAATRRMWQAGFINRKMFTDPHIADFLDFITKMDCNMDIGPRNCMLRGDQLVLTDPVC